MFEAELMYPDAILSGDYIDYDKYPETRVYIVEKSKILHVDKRHARRGDPFPSFNVREEVNDNLSVFDAAGDYRFGFSEIAELLAGINREEIESHHPVKQWGFCIPFGPRQFGAFLSDLSEIGVGGWIPVDEYDLPPADDVERCSWSGLRAKIEELNRSLHVEYLVNEDTDAPLMWAVPALWIDEERGLASCLTSAI